MTAVTVPAAEASAHGALLEPEPLLRVQGLVKTFRDPSGRTVQAVAGVNLQVQAGEVRAIVGESGSGKTTLARCVLRLIEPDAGSIEIGGANVLGMARGALRRLRRDVQIVFQDPAGSLDPRMRVKDIVLEPLRVHGDPLARGASDTALQLLDEVGLSSRHLDRRPHELSGGQCQRVAIARALSLRPRLLVLDEPTSALDVSVQAQILNLLVELRDRHGLTYVLISHDLRVVRHLADSVSVMYLGRIVETQDADTLFDRSAHPYSRALLAAAPEVDMTEPQPILLRGEPQSSAAVPSGCRFHPRCWLRDKLGDPEICARVEPPAVQLGAGSACHFAGEVASLASPATAPTSPAPVEAPAVTLSTWQDPPQNRWSYLHIEEILPTVPIWRGGLAPWGFGGAEQGDPTPATLETLEFQSPEGRETVLEMLDATFTDGFVVVHEGRLLLERYSGEMKPGSRHLLQSVSKSVTAALAGALVGEGLLDPSDLVTDHVRELRGSSFDGCRVEDLLDMRAGTRFSEDYDDLDSDIRVSEQVSGWRPRSRRGLPAGLYAYFGTLSNEGPHGGPFAYRSILTNVLGWVLERAAGQPFAEALSTHVWGRLGAEFDAFVTVDEQGAAVEDGGIAVALRDLARFGRLYLDDGVADGRQVLPADWVRRLRQPNPELVAAFRGPFAYTGIATAELHYHDQWWVLDPRRGIHAALGIHGQMVYVHGSSRTVVVKLSTHPQALDRRLVQRQLSAAQAIAGSLEGSGATAG